MVSSLGTGRVERRALVDERVRETRVVDGRGAPSAGEAGDGGGAYERDANHFVGLLSVRGWEG